MTIGIAIAEALDAVGDDEAYGRARTHLLEADRLLREGTTAEASQALDAALLELDASCPL
ncbi:hypothetical protein ACGFZH_28205 [Streptomyces zaomyceticus]|uniref:hypothetical protein n=1 Tax=Streptomyces zaomyceticus TaxID=68286 RepID=UPI003714D1AF